MSEDEILQRGKEKKAKLQKSKFKQQKLPAWRPNPTLLTTLITFIVFGVIFLVLGVIVVELAENIHEVSLEYHNLEECEENIGGTCTLNFTLHTDFEQPIYVYYQLDNLYQNHRRYVKSRDEQQLRGELKSASDLYNCDPIRTMGDLGRNTSISGKHLPEDAPANPCGLIAKSFFNDSYTVFNSNEEEVKISNEGIAWDTDVKDLYKRPENADDVQWLNVTDERFIVWMRVAGMPNFKKPWGIIHQDMPAGNYTVQIANNYDVRSFEGGKKFFMSTTNAYGGKNTFLAVCYLVVGSL